MAAAAAVASSSKDWKAGVSAIQKNAKRLSEAKTQNDALAAARRLLSCTETFIDEHGRQVFYIIRKFGSKGRYAWCAWWYLTPETEDLKRWLAANFQYDEGAVVSKREFDTIEWNEHRRTPSGSITPVQVKSPVKPCPALKENLNSWKQWSFDEADLATMLESATYEEYEDGEETDDPEDGDGDDDSGEGGDCTPAAKRQKL